MTMNRDEAERREDLAATAESLRRDAQQIVEIEDVKQGLDIDDPRLDALSEEAESIAGDVQRKSRIERAIAADASPRSDETKGRAN
jgi:phosphopantetheine adenylyltransferase